MGDSFGKRLHDPRTLEPHGFAAVLQVNREHVDTAERREQFDDEPIVVSGKHGFQFREWWKVDRPCLRDGIAAQDGIAEAEGPKGQRDVDVSLFRDVAKASLAGDLLRLIDRPAPRRIEIDFIEDEDLDAGGGDLAGDPRQARPHLLLGGSRPVAGAELATSGMGDVEGGDPNGSRRSRQGVRLES